jgi:Flp pilus assembly protein CpaB
MSSHLGMVILVVVGVATVLGVITAAIIETRRMDTEQPAIPQPEEKPSGNKKRS